MTARTGTPGTSESPLLRFVPALRGTVPWRPLGCWPTPVDTYRIPGVGETVYVKREDLAHPLYGGNKLRTLEGHVAAAEAAGARELWSTGAYGSNHATATCLHARAVGLTPGVALFPQPRSRPALANMRAFLSTAPLCRDIPAVALVPVAIARLRARSGAYVMGPGGATPIGALGHVGAALELADQIERHELPAPRVIVVAVGSTCTTAGLLAGLHLAAHLGIAFGPGRAPLPQVLAVRATPWPITSPVRIVGLARRTAALIGARGGRRVDVAGAPLGTNLTVDGHMLGRGYGRAAASTRGAIALMRRTGGPDLDDVYSGKSGARWFQRLFAGELGPHLFWATKSSAVLPTATSNDVARAPRRWRRWLA